MKIWCIQWPDTGTSVTGHGQCQEIGESKENMQNSGLTRVPVSRDTARVRKPGGKQRKHAKQWSDTGTRVT